MVAHEIESSNVQAVSQEEKLDFLVRSLKTIVSQSAKRARDDEAKKTLSAIRERVNKVLDTGELNEMFLEFSDLLKELNESDLNAHIRSLGARP